MISIGTISTLLKFVEILPCADELKKEFEEIKKETEILIQTQEETKSKIDKELDIVCKKIMDLQSKSGCKTEHSRAAATFLKSRLANLET
ncbi:uncharacterized protein CEXT_460561 [Caerostris extrusa]|uniref:Uncharacterized protein n=1 Tax=Caerostris extrusa TaxID=172846 RepID=A0AAV4NYR2_CAEEX|nr:uncharacterized protein CEXT_460561 [Caerostris extrusa]